MKFQDISELSVIKRKNNKIHLSTEIIDSKSNNIKQDKFYLKPNGLWYGCGNSFMKWIIKENIIGNYVNDQGIKYIYKLKLDKESFTSIDKRDPKKILHLKNSLDLKKFTKKYGYKPEDYDTTSINWANVGKDYAGIEISPYQKKFDNIKNEKLKKQFWWYQSWDVASGCIWKPKIIKKCKLLSIKNRGWEKIK